MLRTNFATGLLTLDSGSGLIIPTKPPINDDFRMLKWEGEALLKNVTAGEGANLSLYIADGDLSLAEAVAALDSNAPTDLNDNPGAGVAERYVKLIGCVVGQAAGTARFIGPDGSPVLTVKPRWTFASTKSWNWIVFNNGDELTTGAGFVLRGTAFGVFIR